MDNTQLLKGILEGCILAIISKKETYGYEILTALSDAGFSNTYEGTLYPVLTRLEKNGDILQRKEKSPYGPIRKYYSITDQGRNSLKSFTESYQKLNQSVLKIMEEK